MQLKQGARLSNYIILCQLATGGMSEVYRAWDEQNQREVVLKFSNADMRVNPATNARFQREILIGTALHHPNIQQFYEAGGQKRTPYLVFEYVEGYSLHELLRKEGKLPLDRVVLIGTQLARAIDYIHKKGIYHRDLKPENIIISLQDQVKVLDFGIASVKGSKIKDPQMGTPEYMSPEQVKGKRANPQTDIYSLGIILYEMITGQPPYHGDEPQAIMSQHLTDNPAPLPDTNEKTTLILSEVILKALRRTPSKRWPSMELFGQALENPEKIDLEILKAERAGEKSYSDLEKFFWGIDNGLGFPLAQVILITFLILFSLVALVFVFQMFHR